MFTVSAVEITDGEITYQGWYDADGVLNEIWVDSARNLEQPYRLVPGDDGFLLVATALYEAANQRFGE